MSKKQELIDAKAHLEHLESQLEKIQQYIPEWKEKVNELELEAAVEAETPAVKEEE